MRDPLWDNIALDAAAVRLVDTTAMQRLRYVRQLGHAFLVYPGATHSRFEHALGAHHLAQRGLAALEARGELDQVDETERRTVVLAALLHDIGHYPFSHALEEAGFPSHEAQGVARLGQGELAEALRAIGGPGFAGDLGALICGRSRSPLQGLISGPLDLDKIDYLCRDSRMCGVPYGLVDVDRLLASLTVMDTPDGPSIGVQEKGVSALESLLFAKYQMYRNVYWHHAVRSGTCMFKRAARQAVQRHTLTAPMIAELTDDALMQVLIDRGQSALAMGLRARRLYKRGLDLPASEVTASPAGWIAEDPDLTERVEDAVAREVGLEAGELLLDFPARDNMLSVDLPLRLRDGTAEHLTDEGRAGHLGLPRIAAELYRSARRFRVFVARAPSRPLEGLTALLEMSGAELGDRLDRGERPLASRIR